MPTPQFLFVFLDTSLVKAGHVGAAQQRLQVSLVEQIVEAPQLVDFLLAQVEVADDPHVQLVCPVPHYLELVLGQQPIPHAPTVWLVEDGVPLLLENLVDLGDVPVCVGVVSVE